MNNKITETLSIGLLGLGIGFTVNHHNAYASSYRWVKTKQYKNVPFHSKTTNSAYMWNWNHTKRIHNLKNYPKTTWYLSQSIKMAKGRQTGVYYQVTSGNGHTSGYVWRGYLTNGINPNHEPISQPLQNNLTNQTTAQNNNYTKQILSHLTGLIVDPALSKAANAIITGTNEGKDNDTTYYESINYLSESDQTNLVTVYGGAADKWNGQEPYETFINQSFSKAKFSPTNYAGWRVGVAAANSGINYEGASHNKGEFIILLLPPTGSRLTDAQLDSALPFLYNLFPETIKDTRLENMANILANADDEEPDDVQATYEDATKFLTTTERSSMKEFYGSISPNELNRVNSTASYVELIKQSIIKQDPNFANKYRGYSIGIGLTKFGITYFGDNPGSYRIYLLPSVK
ncbi:hypothetical protein [Lentilactobacillus kosonis]|uniref:D-alanyl-D-alanine carboxypeptidase n=1 Tax=Lentilactobacillus kosonis TaxID=2810561 RepID=A0A401FNC3_9LACO|nr:hypothetical protein [Lentilactobacillus kosonis]GAY73837.1 D-alanyl-D-alanine carboxypeptidase [Lentilactobacillus kosonis]